MKSALEDKLFLELSVRFKKECNECYHKASIDDQLLYVPMMLCMCQNPFLWWNQTLTS